MRRRADASDRRRGAREDTIDSCAPANRARVVTSVVLFATSQVRKMRSRESNRPKRLDLGGSSRHSPAHGERRPAEEPLARQGRRGCERAGVGETIDASVSADERRVKEGDRARGIFFSRASLALRLPRRKPVCPLAFGGLGLREARVAEASVMLR